MQILSKLGKGATSLLLLTQTSQAFGRVGGSKQGWLFLPKQIASNSKLSFLRNKDTSSSLLLLSSTCQPTSSTRSTSRTGTKLMESISPSQSYPDPVIVPPGTSPVESQFALNPIDETCTVLIIGATRGIGLGFARLCIERGAKVIGTYRSEIPSTVQEMKKAHPNSMFSLQMDIADEQSIQNAAEEYKSMIESNPDIIGKSKGLTHVIHNAGIYLPGTSFDGTARGPRQAAPVVTKEVMMKTFEVNTIAPLLVAQNFVPLLSKRSDTLLPVLSFLSSKVGSIDDNGSGGAYAYRSSKSALNNIAKSLSIDLAGEASVVLLHPGYVRTDMTSGNGLIDVDESVAGMLKAIEATDATQGFRFVDFKACLIPW